MSTSAIDIIEFGEFILSIIDEYIQNNHNILAEPKYFNIVHEIVEDTIKKSYGDDFIMPCIQSELIYKNIEFYFENIGIVRSRPTIPLLYKKNINKLKKQLKYLREKPQPAQKADAWYLFRWNHITASSAYKALEKSQCKQNELIISKCSPIDLKRKRGVNINSPFHHGNKYEPLSVIFYEQIYNTKVGEFGCIKHKTEDHLAASPDGINIKEDNPRFGRLLEIKNIVNRDITGIPKKEYWVQMQMQMECCELDECDFLETRFKEYPSEEDFNNDGDFSFTAEGKKKGIIICFYTNNGPLYKYMPFHYNKTQFEKWYDETLDEFTHLTWVRNIYWWLDEHSCVLVLRNKYWFNSVKAQFKKIWNTILEERKTGYEHRKPKKRVKKIKPEGKAVVIKIRTESFDENTKLA